jgi:hypothetical protein
MKRLLLPALLLLACTQGRAQSDSTQTQSLMMGDWYNTDPKTKGLTRLLIEVPLDVHAWRKCLPQDCDWKHTRLEYVATGHCRAVFKVPGETNTLDLYSNNDSLRVTDYTNHTGAVGKMSWHNTADYLFKKGK